MDIIGWLTESADQIPEWVRWLVAALFAAVEVLGVGPLLPGEVAVLVLGSSFDSLPSVLVLIAAVAVGASAGDHVLYAIGRRVGTGLRERKFIRRIGVHRWDAAVAYVERRGAFAIIATRLVPVVRTLTPIAAGVAKVAQPRFTVASLGGSLIWATAWAGAGFALKSSLDAAQELLGDATWIAVAVIAAAVALVAGGRALLRRRAATGAPPLDRSSIVTLATLAVGALLLTGSLVVTHTGAGAAPLSATLGLLAAAGLGLAAPLVTRSPGRPSIVPGVLRLITLAGGVSAIAAIPALPLSLAVTTVLLVGAIEIVRLRDPGATRTPTAVAHLIATGLAVGLLSAPYAWIGGLQLVGTLGSLALLVSLVIGPFALGSALRRAVAVRVDGLTKG